jgi:hypothetical protein
VDHEIVDWLLAVLSVAAILVGSFGVYYLSRRDARLQYLEKKSESNREDIAHVQGYLAAFSSYRPRP